MSERQLQVGADGFGILLLIIFLLCELNILANSASSKCRPFDHLLMDQLIEYICSADSVCSNPCVGPIPNTNTSFFIINVCRKTHIYSKN